MQVQGPRVNINGPGINAYPGTVDINGMNAGGYQTTTTTTYHSSQAAVPQTTSYSINEQHLRTDGTYNNGYVNDGNVYYDQAHYVENERTGCCNRRNRMFGNEFGHKRFGNEFLGNPATLCCRRCCVGLLIALGLLALLGLILGLIFGLRAQASAQASATAASNAQYPTGSNGIRGGYTGGYYLNGVYYVPITAQPRRFYLIYGTETPCNPYNNNSLTTVGYRINPNCNALTTRITQIDWWSTTTPRTLFYNGYSTGSTVSASLVVAVMVPCAVALVKRLVGGL